MAHRGLSRWAMIFRCDEELLTSRRYPCQRAVTVTLKAPTAGCLEDVVPSAKTMAVARRGIAALLVGTSMIVITQFR